MNVEQRKQLAKTLKQNLINQINLIASIEGTEEQCALRDLLTDLRHVANELGLDFEFADSGSFDVYHEEMEG